MNVCCVPSHSNKSTVGVLKLAPGFQDEYSCV